MGQSGKLDSGQSQSAEAFADHLEKKLQGFLKDLEGNEIFRFLSAADTEARLVACFMKWYLLEVFSFGPHVTEATFTAIGRLPKTRPDLMKPMILHDLEEVDHGEMALRDYLRLGGDEHFARSRRISPAAFALGATCRLLAEQENPFAYLGYMYCFEGLTPALTGHAQKVLAAKGFPVAARIFVDFHATEDIGHAKSLRQLIAQVVSDYPEAAAAIDYGFDCFQCVYPVPIWVTALANARKELAGGDRY